MCRDNLPYRCSRRIHPHHDGEISRYVSWRRYSSHHRTGGAVAAGAKFIVSPGLNPKVVKYCVEKGIIITPGCANPSDVEQAIENGLEVVKFFPAEQAGGLNYIKAIAAPYVGMKFMPTGGINAKNVRDYLACDKIFACGGSWMVKGDLVKSGQFDKIQELVKEAVEIVKESRGN